MAKRRWRGPSAARAGKFTPRYAHLPHRQAQSGPLRHRAPPRRLSHPRIGIPAPAVGRRARNPAGAGRTGHRHHPHRPLHSRRPGHQPLHSGLRADSGRFPATVARADSPAQARAHRCRPRRRVLRCRVCAQGHQRLVRAELIRRSPGKLRPPAGFRLRLFHSEQARAGRGARRRFRRNRPECGGHRLRGGLSQPAHQHRRGLCAHRAAATRARASAGVGAAHGELARHGEQRLRNGSHARSSTVGRHQTAAVRGRRGLRQPVRFGLGRVRVVAGRRGNPAAKVAD